MNFLANCVNISPRHASFQNILMQPLTREIRIVTNLATQHSQN
jgi:hypothetical protein